LRTLSTTLLTAQKAVGVTGATADPIWKIVLSRSGQTTRGYDRTRIRQMRDTEEDDNQIGEVLLDNSDGALTSLNFERFQGILYWGYNTGVSRTAWAANTAYVVGDIRVPTTANGYQYRCTIAGTSHATTEPTWGTALGVTQTDGTVTWEMDGNSGDEYSPCAPAKVESQEFHSGMGALLCQLYLIGLPNQMGQDKATSRYTQESGDANTVKTLFTAVTGATLTGYTQYPAITATYDSEDSIIDSFTPADFFSVEINKSRLETAKELLAYTGCKMRAEDDGQIHVLDPVTTGTSYDYEYRFDVATYHTFFSKAIRERFVNPNEEIVKSHPSHSPSYSGSATSATSYALAPKTRTTYRRLASSAQATAIAEALIERNELTSERGSITVPMNAGQEVWDWVKITDSRQNDTRTGNVQYIQRRVKVPEGNEPLTWEMTIRFGRVSELSLLSQYAMTGKDEAAETDRYNRLAQNIGELADYITALARAYDELREAHNNLAAAFNNLQFDELVLRKLTVTEQLIIPTRSG